MSGPIDFTIDFSASIQAGIDAYQAMQEAAFTRRLRALQQTALDAKHAVEQATSAINVQDLKQKQGQRMTRKKTPERRRPGNNSNSSYPNELVPEKISSPVVEQSNTSEKIAREIENMQIAAEFNDLLTNLNNRQIAFSENADLIRCCGDRYMRWLERFSQLSSLPLNSAALHEAREVLSEVEMLLAHGLEVTQQMERRRLVQNAIVESFHAIGYFTFVADAGDLESPNVSVKIVARKGHEEVTVSLPLGNGPVQSYWAGQADEKCVDSFLEHMEQMNNRGLKCYPENDIINTKPRLQQVDRKELPRSRSEG